LVKLQASESWQTARPPYSRGLHHRHHTHRCGPLLGGDTQHSSTCASSPSKSLKNSGSSSDSTVGAGLPSTASCAFTGASCLPLLLDHRHTFLPRGFGETCSTFFPDAKINWLSHAFESWQTARPPVRQGSPQRHHTHGRGAFLGGDAQWSSI